MKPISFPQQTCVVAEDQPPYLPLPAYVDERETISCWRLSVRECLRLLFGGRLWLRQMNFGQPLQPQAPTTVDPWKPVTLDLRDSAYQAAIDAWPPERMP